MKKVLFRDVGNKLKETNVYEMSEYVSQSSSGSANLPVITGPDGKIDSSLLPPVSTGTPVESPKLAETFATDIGTLPGDLVFVSGNREVSKIDDNQSTTIPHGVFGMVWQKPTTTQAKVMFSGIMDGFDGFTGGLPLFVGTDGTPTHTAPSSGMVQQIGFAISSTELFLQISQAFRRS